MLRYESYEEHERHLPSSGRFIIAQFDAESIVVYQAFNEEIARYAIEHGHFGGPSYDDKRITHIKPSFLWMMHYSGWAKKENQENVLAIRLKRSCFDDLLCRATVVANEKEKPEAEVQLSWHAYHDLNGEKTDRLSVKIGLLGEARRIFNESCIQEIEDVTPFVREQQNLHLAGKAGKVQVPCERAYAPGDLEILTRIKGTTISL
jgi:hypothetical protein